MQAMRRYLNSHAELSGGEFRTSACLADRLEELGAQFRFGPDGRGLVVDSHSPGQQPVIAFRADMDTLRLHDEKTVSYRSKERNLLHACGLMPIPRSPSPRSKHSWNRR